MLHGVTLEVPTGGFVGILGSERLRARRRCFALLAGVIRPSRGQVRLDGVDLADVPTRAASRERMAVVPQETHLAFDYTALEVVLMGRYPHLSALRARGAARLRHRARSAGGDGHARARGSAVRHAQRRRETARDHRCRAGADFSAVQAPTGILLLDEPTAALDLAYQLEIAALLRELPAAASPIAIVVSTHDLNFAASLCRTLVLLKDGRVLAAGPTADVLTSENIRSLYGVEADVSRHAAPGHRRRSRSPIAPATSDQ